MKNHPKCTECSSVKSCESFLHGLGSEELAEISVSKVYSTYKKGQTVNVQGYPVFGIYCIHSGKVKVSNVSDSGNETIVRLVPAGHVVGLRALLSGEMMQATITALADSEICFFSKDEIFRILKEHPETSIRLLKYLANTLGEAENRISSLVHDPARARYARMLLDLSKDHGKKVEGLTELDIKLTREEMASLIGTTAETLTRITTEFRANRWIYIRNKIFYLKDLDIINQIALQQV